MTTICCCMHPDFGDLYKCCGCHFHGCRQDSRGMTWVGLHWVWSVESGLVFEFDFRWNGTDGDRGFLETMWLRVAIDLGVQPIPRFWLTLFHIFSEFHMILMSTYCDSDKEFIKNSPLLNDVSNSTSDCTPIHTWLFRVDIHCTIVCNYSNNSRSTYRCQYYGSMRLVKRLLFKSLKVSNGIRAFESVKNW